MKIRKPPGRRLTSLLLTLSLLLALVPAMGTTALAEEQAATGTGTAYDPYVVYTYDQLWNAMDYRGDATGKQYIKLGCDIDTSGENSGYGLVKDKMLEVHTYKLMLNLNGYTLTIKSSESSFMEAIMLTGNMTICDGSGTGSGRILYKHTRAGDRKLIRITGGYTLTLTDGVTLEVDAAAHGACTNTVLWLAGNAHAVIINANLLYSGVRDGESGNPIHWASGVYVEDSATLEINRGEFTRVVVNKVPTADGATNPSVIINGGVFRRPMAICAGNTLDKNGPLTLPIRINGGEFNRIEEPREWYKADSERQFYIYFHNYSSTEEREGIFANFKNEPGSKELDAEVRDCMRTMYRSLFPENAVMQWEDSYDVYQRDGVQKIEDLTFVYTYKDYWMNTDLRIAEVSSVTPDKTDYVYPDKLTVYKGLFDMQARYGGEDAMAGTPADPVVTDLTEDNKLTVTWKEKPPEGLADKFRLVMYYVENTETHQLIGTGNSDGTRTATITLPEVASGKNYQIGLALILTAKHVADPTANPSAIAAKNLWLKSLTTQKMGSSILIPLNLSGPLNAGDTVGPEVTVINVDGVAIEAQSAWRFDEEWEEVDVSEKNPVPVSAPCYKTVTLKALPGYKFEKGVKASLSYGGTPGEARSMTVSADGKTAKVTFTVWSTATYDELKLTILNMKDGNTIPFYAREISGLPKGLQMFGYIQWTETSDTGYSRPIDEFRDKGAVFKRNYSYRCEIWIDPDSGVTVPSSVKATINGKKATYEKQYDDYFSLTSEELIIPDPRVPIGDITMRLEDEPFNYIPSTVLLTPLSTDVTQTLSEWYNSKGELVTGSALAPNTVYIYKAAYKPRDGFRFEPDGFSVKIAGGDNLTDEQFTVTAESLSITYEFTTPEWSSTTVEGVIFSYGDIEDVVTVTMQLEDGTTIDGMLLGSAAGTDRYMQRYFIAGIPAGTHTMRVTKKNHVTYEWTRTFEEGFPALMQYVWLYLLGDVNKDGKINSTDALWVRQSSAGSRTLDDEQMKLADVNCDNKVNSTDALWIRQMSAGSRTLDD